MLSSGMGGGWHPNASAIIARNERMVAVNSILEVDLTGQCNAESIDGVQYSGTGGQLDFVRGAEHEIHARGELADADGDRVEVLHEVRVERQRALAKAGELAEGLGLQALPGLWPGERVIGERHYDVQLMGGIALHRGMIAEMRTGEGKTLTSTLPIYLNAVSGKGVHVVTVNDYLASRDAEWMGRLHRFLGLTVGVNLSQMDHEAKQAAYSADITYGTNNEFGFDYLRDNMVYAADQRVQRSLNYAIVDEVDSILIDEARTPLIISGQAEDHTDLYLRMKDVVPKLTRAAEEKMQLKLPLDAFRAEMVPPHFFMNFRTVDEHGRMLGQSRNLQELRSRFAAKIEQTFARAEVKEEAEGGKGAVLQGLTSWSFGELPEIMEVQAGGRTVIGFPALVDEGETVALRVQDTPEKAAAAHRRGLRRLFALELREQVKFVEKSLPRELGLLFMAWGTEAELKGQIVAATLERTCMLEPLPADAAAFAKRKDEARARVSLVAQEIARLIGAILAEHAALQKKLAPLKAQPAVAEDIRNQCAELLPKDFIVALPFERLAHCPRYLKAAALRIDKLRADPARDARLAQEFAALYKPWERERQARRNSGAPDPWLEEFRWQLEELRVALFAQELKTPMPVSVKRLLKAWDSRPRH